MSHRPPAKSPRPAIAASPSGRAGSLGEASQPAPPQARSSLEDAIARLTPPPAKPWLRRVIGALRAQDETALALAARSLAQARPDLGVAWYVLAVANERAGDFAGSLEAYRRALTLLPEEAEVANDLGRLALRMGMRDVAEQLFRRYLDSHPASIGTISNLACALRDQGRCADAIDILKAAIRAHPAEPLLWNTLGTVLVTRGELAASLTFFDEAVRLGPTLADACYNRGNARLELGDGDGALADCERAMALAGGEGDRLEMQLARATINLARGRLEAGWADYEARLAPLRRNATSFQVEGPRWAPGSALAGKTLLVVGEQGLGDEVLFANLLPDVLTALGPRGKLLLAVEPRLVALFQRSFPSADVVPHVTFRQNGRNFRAVPAAADLAQADLWTPLASLLRRFRRRLGDFPTAGAFLTPDPRRMADWRGALARAPAGRKVGLLWKSMKLEADRARYYAPFELWAPVLRTPGVTFVNLQYGDCAAELAWAARELGAHVWTPPGIDLRNDLDDIAALATCLDLTLGIANATSNIAAACGAATWIISVPGAWTRLGEADRMAWYPQARIFLPPGFGRWEAAMSEIAAALAAS